MKNMYRMSDNDLAMVNGGAPAFNGYDMKAAMRNAAAKQEKDASAKKDGARNAFGWNWGDDWSVDPYWG